MFYAFILMSFTKRIFHFISFYYNIKIVNKFSIYPPPLLQYTFPHCLSWLRVLQHECFSTRKTLISELFDVKSVQCIRFIMNNSRDTMKILKQTVYSLSQYFTLPSIAISEYFAISSSKVYSSEYAEVLMMICLGCCVYCVWDCWWVWRAARRPTNEEQPWLRPLPLAPATQPYPMLMH